jgi:hypothetical protein
VTDVNGCTASFDISVTVNACVGVTEQTLAGGVTLYPNPNNGAFTITINADLGDLLIEVVDLSGRVVYSSMENDVKAGFNKQISLDDIASGAYMLRMTTANGQRIDKIAVQK